MGKRKRNNLKKHFKRKKQKTNANKSKKLSFVVIQPESYELHKVFKQTVQPKSSFTDFLVKCRQILLVGEANFSFTLSLSQKVKEPKILYASCYETFTDLEKKYADAKSNRKKLEEGGAQVYHNVDACKLHENTKCWPTLLKFDGIVFNFPHVGGGSTEEGKQKNQLMIHDFLTSAEALLSKKGSIFITLRNTEFYSSWDIPAIAKQVGLRFLDKISFEPEEFLEYQAVRTNPAKRDAPKIDDAVVYVMKKQRKKSNKKKLLVSERAGTRKRQTKTA